MWRNHIYNNSINCVDKNISKNYIFMKHSWQILHLHFPQIGCFCFPTRFQMFSRDLIFLKCIVVITVVTVRFSYLPFNSAERHSTYVLKMNCRICRNVKTLSSLVKLPVPDMYVLNCSLLLTNSLLSDILRRSSVQPVECFISMFFRLYVFENMLPPTV